VSERYILKATGFKPHEAEYIDISALTIEVPKQCPEAGISVKHRDNWIYCSNQHRSKKSTFQDFVTHLFWYFLESVSVHIEIGEHAQVADGRWQF
jgi:hypothetical protein